MTDAPETIAEMREAAARVADTLHYPDETKISASIRDAIRAIPLPADEVEMVERGLGRAFCDVLAERRRQIGVEGWTPEHDDAHDRDELSAAAACYAHFGWVRPSSGMAPTEWPWGAEWWKPKDRRTDLVRAAALLIAEIERLDRAALSAKREES